ncbi:hypothetical protein ACP70R_048734 [Stipagrostis hirtigluma subsp. patula]
MAGGDSNYGCPFPMKGNRYVPSFMLSTFAERPADDKASRTLHTPPDIHQLMGSDDSGDLQATKGDKFEGFLKVLTLDGNQIKDATKFALDNSDSAGKIAEILTKSLMTKETPVRIKVARLLLMSNILYYRDSAYQTKFQATLPHVMLNLHEFCCNIRGNLVAGILKERVLNVLQDWAGWSLYSNEYLNILREIFLGPGQTTVVDINAIEKKANREDPTGEFELNLDGGFAPDES